MKHEDTYYPAPSYHRSCRYIDVGPRVIRYIVDAQCNTRSTRLTSVSRKQAYLGPITGIKPLTVLVFDDLIVHVRPITN
jgi:hypothetical protein